MATEHNVNCPNCGAGLLVTEDETVAVTVKSEPAPADPTPAPTDAPNAEGAPNTEVIDTGADAPDPTSAPSDSGADSSAEGDAPASA